MMTQLERTKAALHEMGIDSPEQLQKAIRELPPLPIWMFTEPIMKKPDEKKAG